MYNRGGIQKLLVGTMAVLVGGTLLLSNSPRTMRAEDRAESKAQKSEGKLETTTIGGGCFWVYRSGLPRAEGRSLRGLWLQRWARK